MARRRTAVTAGAVPKSISATHAPMTSPSCMTHFNEPRSRMISGVRASNARTGSPWGAEKAETASVMASPYGSIAEWRQSGP